MNNPANDNTMVYRFVEPTITADEGVALLALSARPEVYTGTPLPADTCRRLASTILDGHQQGHSWESRARYSTDAPTGEWDVNQKFRRSRNIAPTLPGLGEAYAAMEAEAVNALPVLGLEGAPVRLKRIDDQCLIYLPGDHISDHADDAASYTDEEGATAWHVIKPQRHVVSVMWLTNQTEEGTGELEFAGGELRFNSLVDVQTGEPLTVQPSAGKMVVFPASAWFRHEVLPVKAGVRVAVTRWWEIVPEHADA